MCWCSQGKVVETGTHSDLLARGGKYAELWARQASIDDVAEPLHDGDPHAEAHNNSEQAQPEPDHTSSGAGDGEMLEKLAGEHAPQGSSQLGRREEVNGSEPLERRLEGSDSAEPDRRTK